MVGPQRLALGVTRRLRELAGRARRRVRTLGRTPVPRESVVEHTHVGAVFDEGVARIRAGMTPGGLDGDYDLAYEHFDLRHFLLQARGLLDDASPDPLRQFMDNGARAKATPEINFQTAQYVARHPHRASGKSPYVQWLAEGRAAGEIADPAPGIEAMAGVLGRTPAQLADELATVRTGLQERLLTGRLGEMFARAEEIEPLIGDVWPMVARPIIPPCHSETTAAQVGALHAVQQTAGFRRARVLIVASDPRWGGGRRAEGHIAHALAQTVDPEDIVVLYTDAGGSAPPGRFPAGVREADLASVITEPMRGEAAMRAVVEVVRSFRADAVVNVNSALLHQAMGTYGPALAASERIFPLFFGNEQMPAGNWLGLPLRYFYRIFEQTAGVLTDSEHLAGWLRQRHRLDPASAARIHVLRAPVDPGIAMVQPAPGPAGARPEVFWAGRFDRQKKVGLAFEVARRMPDVTFRVWGESVLNSPDVGTPPDNVVLEGRYAAFADLDLSTAQAWLYTSGWDGVPSQLLEVAMTGTPVVASRVGGTDEVIDDEGGFLVDDVDDPQAYVDRLRQVLADPEGARERARGLRERLVADRTAEAYAQEVRRVLGAERAEEVAR